MKIFNENWGMGDWAQSPKNVKIIKIKISINLIKLILYF